MITALAIEQRPDVFDGGLATCGPIGDFSQQINYFGDFRVLFDYFFPGVMPGSPISIPLSLIDDWPHYYTATIQPLIFAPTNAITLNQLLNVSHAPYISGLITTVDTSVYDALSYNVWPRTMRSRNWAASRSIITTASTPVPTNDARLNQLVQRFTADAAALDEIDLNYQTTGLLTVPLVTLHTTLDQQVPYWHAQLYRGKVIRNDSLAFHQARVGENLYGHCNFSSNDALSAFGKLVTMVYSPTARFPSPRQYLPLIFQVDCVVTSGAYHLAEHFQGGQNHEQSKLHLRSMSAVLFRVSVCALAWRSCWPGWSSLVLARLARKSRVRLARPRHGV